MKNPIISDHFRKKLLEIVPQNESARHFRPSETGCVHVKSQYSLESIIKTGMNDSYKFNHGHFQNHQKEYIYIFCHFSWQRSLQFLDQTT